MSKKEIKEVLDRVLTWPQERQEDVVRVLTEMEEHDGSTYELTDQQLQEVERRMANPNPKFVTLEEVEEQFAHRRA